ncbi:MAG: hypothetical protein NG737_03865 [Omnitrophica bacterium]|nr:hypothetical protein [Candidatus Omnitrophota bacterium]
MMRKRKAQSILEYILVLAAIITAVIAATSGPDSIVQSAITNMFTQASDVISDKSTAFYNHAAGGASVQ